jgi:hypothetical protein
LIPWKKTGEIGSSTARKTLRRFMPRDDKSEADSDTTPSNAETHSGDKDVGSTLIKPEVAQTNPTTEGVGTTVPQPKTAERTGPGGKNVGPIGIVFLTFFLIAAILLCFYGLIVLWPGPSPSGQLPPGKAAEIPTSTPVAASSSGSLTQSSLATSAPVSTPTPTPLAALSSDSPTQTSSAASPPVSTPAPIPQAELSSIAIFGRQFAIWDEVRLLLIVILAGALGNLVHTVRSVYWYVGNRSLKWSWLAKYILQPFAASALAVIFYVVVRGGFFSPQTTFENTSPFGFAALAALVGLFSEQAVLKLKTVAETVFQPPPPGADAEPQGEGATDATGPQQERK